MGVVHTRLSTRRCTIANNISGRVWTLDTAGAGIIWPFTVWIQLVEWFNPVAAGDLMQLTDIDDKVVIDGRAETANGSQLFRPTNAVRGLKMPTLASGTVYVHIK